MKKNWQIKKLNDVSKKLSLNKLKIKQKEYLPSGLFPVIDQGQDLIGGYYNDESLLVSDEPPYIIFGDHTKVKKYITFKFIPGADGVKVLKAKENILPKFLFYLLFTIKIEDKGYARHFQLLEKESFLIPNNTETQQAIVSKIEELFSELDKGIEDLKTAQQQLKTYRQSVLKWAFEGKLTNENVKDGELPKGWKEIIFNDFSKLQRGHDLPLSKIEKGNFPVVTSAGVNGYHNEFKANGPCLTTGRSGSVGNINFIEVEKYWPHNTVLFVKDFCNNYPKFVYYFYKQFNFKSYSASTAVPTLDRKQLFNVMVKKPPIEEQHHIVQEIESRLSVADKMEESIAQSLQQAEALRQSILKKAFSGELV
jgi:type I restriction enzyme, S subunit